MFGFLPAYLVFSPTRVVGFLCPSLTRILAAHWSEKTQPPVAVVSRI